MSSEENKATVRRFIEAYNKHDPSLLGEFFAPDYFDHTHQLGAEDVKQLFHTAFEAFPDWHETLEDIIAEGDRVWVRLSYEGTHTGEWNPGWGGVSLPPTGKKITAKAVDIYRIADGKLAEYWNVTDASDFNTQLGLTEPTETGKRFFPKSDT